MCHFNLVGEGTLHLTICMRNTNPRPCPGTAFFPYTTTDWANGLNASAYVHITIVPPPVILSAGNDSYVGDYNRQFNLTNTTILANDNSSSLNPQLEVVWVGNSTDGDVVGWDKNGTFQWMPPPNWTGVYLCARFGFASGVASCIALQGCVTTPAMPGDISCVC